MIFLFIYTTCHISTYKNKHILFFNTQPVKSQWLSPAMSSRKPSDSLLEDGNRRGLSSVSKPDRVPHSHQTIASSIFSEVSLFVCRCRNGRAVRLLRDIVEPNNVLDWTIGRVNGCSCGECQRLEWNSVVSATSLGLYSWLISRLFPYHPCRVVSLYLGITISSQSVSTYNLVCYCFL